MGNAAHCDGAYTTEDKKTGDVLSTHYTVHLYLNDSWAEMEKEKEGTKEPADAAAGPGPDDLVGGATMFLSDDDNRRVDVDPKYGRVLIFQHEGLYHGGDDVVQGVKLTMRTGELVISLCSPYGFDEVMLTIAGL